jgi:uncharacterized protein DUF6221
MNDRDPVRSGCARQRASDRLAIADIMQRYPWTPRPGPGPEGAVLMTDLVEFLTARLDEDEQVARAATKGPWSVNDESYAETIYSADGAAVVAGGRWGGEASVFESTDDAIHIARHDPARVLREVEAKRTLLNTYIELRDRIDTAWREYSSALDGKRYSGPTASYTSGELAKMHALEDVLKTLALPYADHPEFQEEWRV